MKALLAKQQVRFLIAGCFNTALDFLILNVLTLALGLMPLVANSTSVVFGICISYALNHFFVFQYPYRIAWKKFAEFFLFTGFSSLIIQNVIIYLFELLFQTKFGNSLLIVPDATSRHFIALNVAKLVAVLVGLIWNYLMYKHVVFRLAAQRDPVGIHADDEPPTALLDPTE